MAEEVSEEIDSKSRVEAVKGNLHQVLTKGRERFTYGANRLREKIAPTTPLTRKIDWETVRKPQLLKHFAKEGFENPKVAVEVVDFLQNNFGEIYRDGGFLRTEGCQYYQYQEKDKDKIRRLSQGVENPTKLLQLLGNVIEIKHGWGGGAWSMNNALEVVSAYFDDIKNDKKLPDLLNRVSQMGFAWKLNPTHDISINYNTHESIFQVYRLGDYPDGLRMLLDLSSDEYEKLLSQENISWVSNLNKMLWKKKPSFTDWGVLNVVTMPYLLQIGTSPVLRSMYMESVVDMANQMKEDWHFVDEIDRLTVLFQDLEQNVPELTHLHSQGVDLKAIIGDGINYRKRDDNTFPGTYDVISSWLYGSDDRQSTVRFKEIFLSESNQFITPDLRAFWQYLKGINTESMGGILLEFMLTHRERFSEFVIDGKETDALYKTILEEKPNLFVVFAGKDEWRVTFGEDTVNAFLDSLPAETDEKRNAFTHNEYDRTSQFIAYMLENVKENFSLNSDDLQIMTEYIRHVGFSRTPLIYRYFKNLYLFEQQKIPDLPKDMISLGLTSINELTEQFNKVREVVYSETPMIDLSSYTKFGTELLNLVTGRSTHRWGGQPIEKIMADFESDVRSNSIEALPEGYNTLSLETSKVRIEFNAEAIQEDYEILKNEILTSIQSPQDVEGLKEIIQDSLQHKIEDIEQAAVSSEGKRQETMLREISSLQEYIPRLAAVPDLDSLMSNLLEMNFDKTEQRLVSSIFRRIIFSKVFQKHFSPGFVHDIQTQLEGSIAAASIESVVNVVDEMAKTHALNLEGNNTEGYWNEETFTKIKGSKRGRDLPHCFSPHIGKIKEEVENFQRVQIGQSNVVKAIPDRGFVGEMSGYLADVCYTKVYPLLKQYPNVIPYKFVADSESGPRFIGSVLVFELSDSNNNPSLLVRAFDIPRESDIDIGGFIEQFLDKLTNVGRGQGKKQILVPGNSGAISNYQMTINHMTQNYSIKQTPVSLSESFNFNGYDLTNNCYVARVI